MMFEMAKPEPKVFLELATPGYCKTAFNGYQGLKSVIGGAVDLALSLREHH